MNTNQKKPLTLKKVIARIAFYGINASIFLICLGIVILVGSALVMAARESIGSALKVAGLVFCICASCYFFTRLLEWTQANKD